MLLITKYIRKTTTVLKKKTKKKKGPAGFEPATYRAATDCSTTELRPLDLNKLVTQ